MKDVAFEISNLQADMRRLKERLAEQDTEIESLRAAIKIMLAAVGRRELEDRKNGG
jgi:hypothetical protein